MLPPPEKFSSRMRSMGIGDGSRIVVYDSAGLFSAARVWWTFRVMGVEDVSVLNGGLPKWKREGRPLESGEPPSRTARHFTARRNARSRARCLRHQGADQGPIGGDRRCARGRAVCRQSAGAASGASLGAYSRARTISLTPSCSTRTARSRSAPEIERLFEEAGVDLSKPVVASCGSGITASVLALALAEIGHRRTSVYDGSWSEWGADQNLPIETG